MAAAHGLLVWLQWLCGVAALLLQLVRLVLRWGAVCVCNIELCRWLLARLLLGPPPPYSTASASPARASAAASY